MTHRVDAADEILIRRGAGQFLEAEPGAVRRAHAQQDFEARIGRGRTQGQDGLRQKFDGIRRRERR